MFFYCRTIQTTSKHKILRLTSWHTVQMEWLMLYQSFPPATTEHAAHIACGKKLIVINISRNSCQLMYWWREEEPDCKYTRPAYVHAIHTMYIYSYTTGPATVTTLTTVVLKLLGRTWLSTDRNSLVTSASSSGSTKVQFLTKWTRPILGYLCEGNVLKYATLKVRLVFELLVIGTESFSTARQRFRRWS